MNEDINNKYSIHSTDNIKKRNKNIKKVVTQVNYIKNCNKSYQKILDSKSQQNIKDKKNTDNINHNTYNEEIPILEYKTKHSTLKTDDINKNIQYKKININLKLLKVIKEKMKEQKYKNLIEEEKKETTNDDNNSITHEKKLIYRNEKEEEIKTRKNLDEEKRNKLLNIINSKKFNKFQRNDNEKQEESNHLEINNRNDINSKDNNFEKYPNSVRNKKINTLRSLSQKEEQYENIDKLNEKLTDAKQEKQFETNIKTKITPPINNSNSRERSPSFKKDAMALLELLKMKKKEENENLKQKNEVKTEPTSNDNRNLVKKINSYNYKPRKREIETFRKDRNLEIVDSFKENNLRDYNNKTEHHLYNYKTINNTEISNNNNNDNKIKNYFNINNKIINPLRNTSNNSYINKTKNFPKISKVSYNKPISIKNKNTEKLNTCHTLDNNINSPINTTVDVESQNTTNKNNKKQLDNSFDIIKKRNSLFTKKILNKSVTVQGVYISKKISSNNSKTKLIKSERNTIGPESISYEKKKTYLTYTNKRNKLLKPYIKKSPDKFKKLNNNTNETGKRHPNGIIYKNKTSFYSNYVKPIKKNTTIETNSINRTDLSLDTTSSKRMDTISYSYNNYYNKTIGKIQNIKNNSVSKQQNNNSVIFNLEDLMVLEERLNDIIIALETNENISNKCFNFWNYYYNCSLSNLIEKIFKNKEDSNIVRLSINYELISIMVCYEYSFEIDNLAQEIFYLLIELIDLNHQNLIIICEYILAKIDPENMQNIWVLKLQQIIKNSKKNENCDNSYPKNNIKTINLNTNLLIKKLKNILQKYPTEYSDIYTSLLNNLDPLTYEEINNFFRKYILRVDNFEGSIIASSYLKKNKYFKSLPAPYITYPSPKPYTLVLDLDETLVHFKIKTSKEGTLRARPYLFSFLEEMGHYYELIVWTSATEGYANSLIDAIEYEKKYFDSVLFREHAIIIDDDFVKDLTRIGRDLDKIIIVDDMPQNFRLQKENGINIKPFFGDDMDDSALYELVPILKNIALSNKDVRIGINKYREEIIKKVTSNISRKNEY